MDSRENGRGARRLAGKITCVARFIDLILFAKKVFVEGVKRRSFGRRYGHKCAFKTGKFLERHAVLFQEAHQAVSVGTFETQ